MRVCDVDRARLDQMVDLTGPWLKPIYHLGYVAPVVEKAKGDLEESWERRGFIDVAGGTGK